MTPSSPKNDPVSPTKPTQRPFSIATNNQRPPAGQLFRQGSIGSKSWKLTDSTNSRSSNSENPQEKKASLQRLQSGFRLSFSKQPKTPLPAAFSQGFSFSSRDRLVRSTAAASKHGLDFSESKVITSPGTSVSFKRSTRLFEVPTEGLVQTPPTPSSLRFSPSNSPLSSAAHSLQAPSIPSPLPIITICPMLPAISSVSDPQAQMLHETSSTSQNGSPRSVATHENLYHETQMEIEDGPTFDENQVEEEVHFEDVQPTEDRGLAETLNRQDIGKGTTCFRASPDFLHGFIFFCQPVYRDILTPPDHRQPRFCQNELEAMLHKRVESIEERYHETLRALEVTNASLSEIRASFQTTQERQYMEATTPLEAMATRMDDLGARARMQDERHLEAVRLLPATNVRLDKVGDNLHNLQEEQFLDIVKTLEATNGRLDKLGASVHAAQDERHQASAKTLVAMKEQLFELKTSVERQQERQHLQSLNLLETMGTRFDEFRGSTLPAQDERYHGVERTLETTAVHLSEIKAEVQILQKARHLEHEKMLETMNARLSDLRTDVQTLQKERCQEAERTLDTTDRQLSEFKVHVQSLQDSVRRFSEERARLLHEKVDNEVQVKEVNSLTAELRTMLDKKIALSEELKKRAESELATKSRCDDQWVQIGQLKLQTQELSKELVATRSQCQRLEDVNNAVRNKLEAAEKVNKGLETSLQESQSKHAAQIKSTIHEFEQIRMREAVEIQNQNKKTLHWISELEADLEEKNNILKLQEQQRNGLLKEQEDQINRMLSEQENDRHEIRVSKERLQQLEQDLKRARQEKDATGSLINANQLLVESPPSMQEAPMLLKDIAREQSRDRSLDSLTEFLQWPMDFSTASACQLRSLSCQSLYCQPSQSQRTHSQVTESEPIEVASSTSNMSKNYKTNAEADQEAAMESVCETSSVQQASQQDVDDTDDFTSSQPTLRSSRTQKSDGNTGLKRRTLVSPSLNTNHENPPKRNLRKRGKPKCSTKKSSTVKK